MNEQKVRWTAALAASALGAGYLVYREVTDRARLLAGLFRSEDDRDRQFSDQLAAYAEPVTLPKPLARRKVS